MSTSRWLEGRRSCGGVCSTSTAGAGPSAAAVSGKNTRKSVVFAHLYSLRTTVPSPLEKGSYDAANRELSAELNVVVVSVE